MIQVSYVSRAVSSLPSDEVFRIIETSARNNLRDDLTGFLIYSGSKFFQVVEGPGGAIDALLAKLDADARHSSIEILSRHEIEGRSFPKWRMKRIKPDTKIDDSTLDWRRGEIIPPHLTKVVSNFIKESARSGGSS